MAPLSIAGAAVLGGQPGGELWQSSVCSLVTLFFWGFDSRCLGAPRMPVLSASPSFTWHAVCCACPVEWQEFIALHSSNALERDGVSGPTKVELCGHHV